MTLALRCGTVGVPACCCTTLIRLLTVLVLMWYRCLPILSAMIMIMRRMPRMVLGTRHTSGRLAPDCTAGRQQQSWRAASTGRAMEADAQLNSLEEVNTARDLTTQGRRAEAASLLQRAVDICKGSMGEESALAQAAVHRLAQVLYDDQCFAAAEAALTRGRASDPGKVLPVGEAGLRLLSKAQMFQGKVTEAVESCSRAVTLCERDEDYTPDTEAIGKALRQLGATQMLVEGAEDDAETSLLRAARLGASGADQGKGLSVLAAFNASTGDEHRIEEATELWNEACTTTKAAVEEIADLSSNIAGLVGNGDEKGEGDADTAVAADASAAIRLSRASVLCSSAQGELLLDRGSATASERLAEALKIREELLPVRHPSTAWTLALLGRCHLMAGEAVTAEGLLRAAVDGFGGVGEDGVDSNVVVGGQAAAGTIISPSPLHSFSKAGALRAYSELLAQWEKREAEGEGLLRRAEKVECSLRVNPPGGLTMHMLHLDNVY